MKSLIHTLVFAIALTPAAMAQTGTVERTTVPGLTCIIPIHGQIEEALVYTLERMIADAKSRGASRVIFDMDTPGGRLDSTETIIDLIDSLDVPTYTLVNPNAISAGAIIAMGTDHIYMTPRARIGDAIPLMASPFGTPEALPDDLKEKAVSPTEALIRAVAQRNGHDDELAAKMVRVDHEYKIGDTVISPAGQVVTLTATDAAQMVGDPPRPLLSRGTVESMDELLKRLGADTDKTERIEQSVSEEIARWISSFPISGILLGLGLLGIYVEFKTPGFGLPGMGGTICLAIWYFGHHIAGLAGMEEALLFLVGLALVLVEVFIFPGFGLPGIAGIFCMIAGAMLGMVDAIPGVPWYDIPTIQFNFIMVNFGTSLVVLILGALLLAKLLPHTSLYGRLVLTTNQTGYTAGAATTPTVGSQGVTVTALRPAGIATINGQRVDVVAQGDFLDANTPIVVAAVKGNRIVVTKNSAAN